MALVCNAKSTVSLIKELFSSKSLVCIRFKSKGVGKSNQGRPGHHGWKRQTNDYVTGGTILATQYDLRWCAGLNVGIGGRGELYAKVPGIVKITCEKTDFNSNNPIVKKWYPSRETVMYKKYYNVIPEPNHKRFKLLEQI